MSGQTSLVAQQVRKTIMDAMPSSGATIQYGTVVSLENDSTPFTVSVAESDVFPVRACECEVGDRVVMLVLGTQWVAVGVVSGRPVFSDLGLNPIASVDDDTTQAWRDLGSGVAFYNKADQLHGQVGQYGILLNLAPKAWGDIRQVWFGQRDSDVLWRGGNTNGWAGWRRANDSSNGIESQGTSNSWRYVRFTSGLAICEYEGAALDRKITNASGGIYWASTGSFPNFPFAFVSAPQVSVSLVSSGNAWCWNGGTSTTNVGTVYFGRGTSQTINAAVRVVATGRWK